MSANKSVTVLTPNGRRPVIKISPNTTILQILEEACQKYNLNPDEYDLKHYNKILDVNLIFRYANISNNACLEMVKCNTPRKVSNITTCIQLEDGKRLIGEFPPNVNIEDILKNLDVAYNVENAVIIYMQRELCGKEFGTVTLRSLGLGNGKVLFRLLHRDADKLKEQAHVYLFQKPKIAKTEESEENKPCMSSIACFSKSKAFDVVSTIKAEKECMQRSNETKIETNNKSIMECTITKETNQPEIKEISKEDVTPMEVDKDIDLKSDPKTEEELEVPQVEFLGERNALLFNQAGAKAIHQDDIPDNFFELTVNDAKTLLRDVKTMQAKLEDSPLLTAAQRELEKDKSKLNQLHKYQQTVIRIQFLNQLVLQAVFGPLETVQAIKDFIKTYLEHPENDFVLYTSPPRCDLIPEERIFNQDLVPSTIIYYSGMSDLKPEIKSKLTDSTAASFQAAKTRLTTTRKDNSSLDDDLCDFLPSTTTTIVLNTADVRNGIVETQPGPSSRSTQAQKSKAPKWFKLSSK